MRGTYSAKPHRVNLDRTDRTSSLGVVRCGRAPRGGGRSPGAASTCSRPAPVASSPQEKVTNDGSALPSASTWNGSHTWAEPAEIGAATERVLKERGLL